MEREAVGYGTKEQKALCTTSSTTHCVGWETQKQQNTSSGAFYTGIKMEPRHFKGSGIENLHLKQR